ncbi:MAG: cobyrinate a,c-diamide synthase [bacterium]|nr:cobyrinate a,c-diamide synthase [bacterium]
MLTRPCPRLLISAPSKSSGKTTVTLGLARALKNQGHRVQCFKKGPDFIDPQWHALATGRPSYNLDSWMMPAEVMRDSLERRSRGASLSIIEGNHGLHDGLDPEGGNSSAGLALYLKAPVLLVVDVTGLNRAAGALVLGQVSMPPQVPIAGVLLNRVKSPRQAEKAVAAIERFAGVKVWGTLPEAPQTAIAERHLGLTTSVEDPRAEERIAAAAEWVAGHVDLEAVVNAANQAASLAYSGQALVEPWLGKKRRLGVVRNEAFCFYYPDNLEALEQAGAELVFIDPIRDAELPEIDGLYIGGGFPESFFKELSANRGFMDSLRQRLEGGLPYWAECGGLIYLAQKARYQGQEFPLVGWLEGEIDYSKKPVGYGYMELEPKGIDWLPHKLRCHEFHYSRLSQGTGADYAFAVSRGTGLGEEVDGLIKGRGLASYAHLHSLATPNWAPGFMDQVRQSSIE